MNPSIVSILLSIAAGLIILLVTALALDAAYMVKHYREEAENEWDRKS